MHGLKDESEMLYWCEALQQGAPSTPEKGEIRFQMQTKVGSHCEEHWVSRPGSDCILFTGLLAGAQNFNQRTSRSLYSLYVSLQLTLPREKTVPVYPEVKISEGRTLCGFHRMENGCGEGHGQMKCLFVRKQNITQPFRD